MGDIRSNPNSLAAIRGEPIALATPPDRTPEHPHLSIIIISWNTRDFLADCLRSILDNPPKFTYEIIVVDSASEDGTVVMLNAEFPTVRLLAQAQNIGFVRGNNIGFTEARGDYLLMLNPDTEIIGTALDTLIDYMTLNPSVGIAGPRTLNSDGSLQSTKRRFPTLLTGIFESTWLQPFAPRAVLDYFYASEIPDQQSGLVDWVQGSALLFRRAVYRSIGGLDEGFAMYSEETDFCKRAKDAGWAVAYVASAQVIHHGGKSTAQASVRTQVAFQKSKVRYFLKHNGWFAALIVRTVILLNYGQQWVMETLKWALGHKRPLRRARMTAYTHVIRALLGLGGGTTS
jgi:GT2 family glycosyltransferase